MMRTTRILLTCSLGALVTLAFAASVHAQADTYHTPLDPDQSGGIVGTVTNAPGELQRVIAFEAFELKAYAADLDADAGTFELRGLPAGEYDLFIKSVGHVHEGLTLELNPTADPSPEELGEWVEGVGETLYPSERYFDVKDIVRFTSDGDVGRALVTFTRTRQTVGTADDDFRGHVRRFAVVEMHHTRDVWQIGTVRHLLRQEVPAGSDDIDLDYTHSPELGQILVGQRVQDLGEIDLSDLEPGPEDRYASASNRGNGRE